MKEEEEEYFVMILAAYAFIRVGAVPIGRYGFSVDSEVMQALNITVAISRAMELKTKRNINSVRIVKVIDGKRQAVKTICTDDDVIEAIFEYAYR
jgi:hypothetical protein